MRGLDGRLAAGILLLATACASSPPTRFYALEPIPPAHRTEGQIRPPVKILAVHVPPLLDREQIVREGSPGELIVSDTNRWGAPLAEMTRDVLTQDLLLRLPEGSVILPQQPAPPQTNTITVDILHLQAQADGAVLLEGGWSLIPPGTEAPSLARAIHISEPSGAADYARQARAMSLALGQLADDIARMVSGHDGQAPAPGAP